MDSILTFSGHGIGFTFKRLKYMCLHMSRKLNLHICQVHLFLERLFCFINVGRLLITHMRTLKSNTLYDNACILKYDWMVYITALLLTEFHEIIGEKLFTISNINLIYNYLYFRPRKFSVIVLHLILQKK